MDGGATAVTVSWSGPREVVAPDGRVVDGGHLGPMTRQMPWKGALLLDLERIQRGIERPAGRRTRRRNPFELGGRDGVPPDHGELRIIKDRAAGLHRRHN